MLPSNLNKYSIILFRCSSIQLIFGKDKTRDEREFILPACTRKCMIYILKRINPSKSTGKLYSCIYVPPAFTINSSAQSPQRVVMGLIWFSQQTTIISLMSINQLIFLVETGSLSVEGTELLNIIHTNFSFKG
jgi:hypothetical protein